MFTLDVEYPRAPAAPGVHAALPLSSTERRPESEQALSLVAAAEELSACRDADAMLRLATQLARASIGLERVGFYMRDQRAGRIIVRGTWGTGLRGELTDEHSLFHELAPENQQALLNLRATGALGVYRHRAPRFALESGRTVDLGLGWLMATPLVAARDLLGVMYNDAALTETPVDRGKQDIAAVFCTLLGILYLSRRGTIPWQPLPVESGHSPLVERIVCAVKQDLPVRGERLARDLGVSPGHLARAFKREMGVSLVDYRNRLRIDRFFETINRSGRSGNLLDAALEAGFGSYAQFHRIYRKFVGSTPRRSFNDLARAQGVLPPAAE
jgi:AraC-like DNA-binding protein